VPAAFGSIEPKLGAGGPNEDASSWTYSQIYAFQDGNDSGSPYAPPVFDASGNIYVSSTGTLISPKSYGAILKLTPVLPGDYTPTVIHTFSPSDATDPAGMLTTESGDMYGFATYGGSGNAGALFSLSPSPQ
jgi:hypothetical protein